MPKIWTPDEALFRLTVSDLAATPPVSPAKERRLIAIMIEGKQAAERLTKESNLSLRQRQTLETKNNEGIAARKMLIQANGRLVISIATQYMGQGLSLAELSQEGVLGLIRAIDKFDMGKGNRLSTYATFWIRQTISRALASQTRTIRLPIYKIERLNTVKRVIGRLTQELGRPPEIEEIAAETGQTPEKIRELLHLGQETVSLEEPVGDDEVTLADFVGESPIQAVEEHLDRTMLGEKIEKELSELSARESRIVELRFGLRDGQPRTLQEISERFGLTRERIRQLEKEALFKLRQAWQVG